MSETIKKLKWSEAGWFVEYDGGTSARHHETPLEALEEAKTEYDKKLADHIEYSRLVRQKRELEDELEAIKEELKEYRMCGDDLMPDIKVINYHENGDVELLWENGQLVK